MDATGSGTTRIRLSVPGARDLEFEGLERSSIIAALQEHLRAHRDVRAPLHCLCRGAGVPMIAAICPGGEQTGRLTLRCHEGSQGWHMPGCALRHIEGPGGGTGSDPAIAENQDGSVTVRLRVPDGRPQDGEGGEPSVRKPGAPRAARAAPRADLTALLEVALDRCGLNLWRPQFEGRRDPVQLLLRGCRGLRVEGRGKGWVPEPILLPGFARGKAWSGGNAAGAVIGLVENDAPAKSGGGRHLAVFGGLTVFVSNEVFDEATEAQPWLADPAPGDELRWIAAVVDVKPSRRGTGAFLPAAAARFMRCDRRGVPYRTMLERLAIDRLGASGRGFCVLLRPLGDGPGPEILLVDRDPPEGIWISTTANARVAGSEGIRALVWTPAGPRDSLPMGAD